MNDFVIEKLSDNSFRILRQPDIRFSDMKVGDLFVRSITCPELIYEGTRGLKGIYIRGDDPDQDFNILKCREDKDLPIIIKTLKEFCWRRGWRYEDNFSENIIGNL